MLSPYSKYEVYYSYYDEWGGFRHEYDTEYAESATEAVQIVRSWRRNLKNFRIERVYVETLQGWETCGWYDEEEL